VAPLQFKPGMSVEEKTAAFEQTGRKCSSAYFESASKDVRVEDGIAVIRALQGESWVQQLLLVGHSEGSHVVTGIVRQSPSPLLTAAALMSSAGPTQFFGFYLSQAGDRQAFCQIFDQMRMLRNADDGFMHRGLPARRWKSYALNSTPLDDVRDSRFPLYVAHGELEKNVLAADLFVLEAASTAADPSFALHRPERRRSCVRDSRWTRSL
jgi:pimeloyl-ACP methyl ester carboxylesterase